MGNQTVSMAVKFNAADTAVFDKLAKETPQIYRSAVGRAFSILRRNMIKVMQGEASTYIPALRPWHPLTNRITRFRQFGGALSFPNVIRMFKDDANVLRVGWITKLSGAAHSWQEAETHAMSKPERRRLHIILSRMGEKNHSLIPMVYQRPQRDVVTTLAENTADKMSGWILGAYEKQIAQHLAKGTKPR